MRGLAALIVALVPSCAEPTIQMALSLPIENTDFSTSCLTAVDVYIYGETYPEDPQDYRFDCLPVEDQATYAQVRASIRGKFDVALPDTGLQAVEIDGRTGPCLLDDTTISNLIWHSSEEYDGSEGMVLQMTPVTSCTVNPQVKVRVVDLLPLITTKDCAMALHPDGPTAGVDLGQIAPSLYNGNYFYTPFGGKGLTGGVTTLSGLTTVGSDSCLAAGAGSENVYSVSCAVPGSTVCALQGELEFATIAVDDIYPNLDIEKLASHGDGVIIGSVWNMNAPKAPMADVTIEYDTELGELVYFDTDGTTITPTNRTTTGPSGLFVLYSNEINEITVRSPRGVRKVKIASGSGYPAVALIGI